MLTTPTCSLRSIKRHLLLLGVLVLTIFFTGAPAWADEILLYDVSTSTFTSFMNQQLFGGTERIQIIDHGPQTDRSPRWTTQSLGVVAIWDEAINPGPPDMLLFGNSCGALTNNAYGLPTPRLVQANAGDGGGDFSWLPGVNPNSKDGAFDPVGRFCLKFSHQSNTTWSETVAIGTRVYPAPPPPSPVKVFITWPKSGATVSGTVWVVLWAEGTTGISNVFTLSADGKQVGSKTTSSRGPVTIPWVTKPAGGLPVLNGTHTLTGTVRDATGNTGTTSIAVIVNN